MKPHYSKPILATLLALLTIFSIPLVQVHANPQPASTTPLTGSDTIPLTYVNATPPPHQYTLTLITGDKLYVTKLDTGSWSVAVKEAPRQYGTVPFETFVDSQKETYAVPADIVSRIPSLLDPSLFNLDYLTGNRLNDESMTVIGAVAQYSPGMPLSGQWDTNVVHYSNLPIINSQALSIPKTEAATFGSYILGQPQSLPNGIQKIWLDRVATSTLDQSVPLIGGDIARNVLGFDGSGIKIAILDTGIDATHPDFFFPNGTSKVIVRVDETCAVEPKIFCDNTPNDLFGHGTHVSSIAAGTGAASAGRFTGVAPGASLMNVKVLNQFGFGFDSWIIFGMQQAAQGINGIRADVMSMSLGGSPTDGSDPLSQAVNKIVNTFGIPIAVAAGNFGCDACVSNPGAADSAITVAATTKVGSPIITETTPTSRGFLGNLMEFSPPIPTGGITANVVDAGLGLSSTDFPANTPGSIALIQRGQIFFRTKAFNAANAGAVAALIYNNVPGNFQGTLISPGVPIPVISMSQANGLTLKADVDAGPTTVNLTTGPITIASFSSRGPRVDNFDIKPDIATPGVGVVAACSSTATVITCPAGAQYAALSGTSMATPHVSGSIALLLQQARNQGIVLTPSTIKNILQSSSNILIPPLPDQPDVNIYQQGAGLVRIDRALTASVLFNSAEISFGVVPVTTSSLQRTFQVTNRGTTTVTLTLSWEMRDVPTQLSPLSTNATYNNLVSLDQTQLTIAAGGSATVTLTINVANAPTQKLWSVFSGRIFASSGNTVVAHAIFGFTKEGPRQTAIVTGINPDGSPAAFQSYSFYDALDRLGLVKFFASFDSTGHASLRLPLSSYNFVTEIITFQIISTNPFQFTLNLYRILAIEVPVTSSPASVTLDASKVGPVRLDLQADPKATNGLQQDDIFAYIRPDGSNIQFASFLLGRIWDLYAVNTASASIGTLWLHDRWVVTRSPAETSPVLYDLTMTSHVQQPTIHTVDDLSALGQTNAKFHADIPGTKFFGRFSFPTAFLGFISFSSFFPVAAPSQRTEYQQANAAVFRQFFVVGPSIFWFDTPFITNYFGLLLMGKVYAPGEVLTETWVAQPIHPKLTLAQRQGNTLTLSGFEVTDNFGHFGLFVDFFGVQFQIAVFVNGVLRAFNNHISFTSINVPLPSTAANVEVIMQLRPDPSWSTLATRGTSDTVFQTSSSIQGALLLPTNNYDVKTLNLANQVPVNGEPTNLLINVAVLTPTSASMTPVSASAQISLDDGATWADALLVKIMPAGILVNTPISTTGPGPFLVSLRMTVVTAEGTSYTQTIIRAVQIVQSPMNP